MSSRYPITVTITTASNADTSTYTKIPLSPGKNVPTGNPALGDQVMRICASIDTSGGTAAALRFVLRSASRVYKVTVVTVTVITSPGAIRTGIDGSSGDYLMTVAGDANDFIDLSGHCNAGTPDEVAWYVGLAGAFGGSATSLRLDLFPVRAN